ncbi:hypothetical protein BKH43_06285 [Helicobacter sp. 13S00401-1]|uniref:TrkH family potassium uptake protein n=1 Tax=Helicobacter sp. 13S00401-1 TaxID=1905758 RepID=UPI000BA64D0E|nr:potassium transporter TrkG [Helicobacter sp. 13S00401-1]PAF49695.1 hypothetical protein BKH43_06285 [Helicobacter sp. 13S00401-1]
MQLKSIRIILVAYIGIILVGAIILTLPGMHNGPLNFTDALFTSVSALTCTGIIVKDTALDFSVGGQVTILVLIQIGGFGYMSALGLLYLFVRKKLSNSEKNLIKENINYSTLDGLGKVMIRTIIFVLSVEVIAAIILSIRFSMYKNISIGEGIYAGIFHAISAFNNAGFSIFSTNLAAFRGDLTINLVICLLIIIGGLGYVCMLELNNFCLHKIKAFFTRRYIHIRMSLNTKVILLVTAILLVGGTLIVLFFEWNNPDIMNMKGISNYEKILSAFFASVNYRTAGFNTFDLSHLTDADMFFSTFLMNIGGSPGGTASGIKVTTLAVLIAYSYSIITNQKQTKLFNRAIPQEVISKSITVFIIASTYIFVATFLLTLTQKHVALLPILYEVGSAFATVGVSVGNGGTVSLSANFNEIGRIIIMLLMLGGKVGILSFTLIFSGTSKSAETKYVEEQISI